LQRDSAVVGLVEVLLSQPYLHDHVAPVRGFELHPAQRLSAPLSSPLIDDRKILVPLEGVYAHPERRSDLAIAALNVCKLLDQFEIHELLGPAALGLLRSGSLRIRGLAFRTRLIHVRVGSSL